MDEKILRELCELVWLAFYRNCSPRGISGDIYDRYIAYKEKLLKEKGLDIDEFPAYIRSFIARKLIEEVNYEI